MRRAFAAVLAAIVTVLAAQGRAVGQKPIVRELAPVQRSLPKGRSDFVGPRPVCVQFPGKPRPHKQPVALPPTRGRAWVPVIPAQTFEGPFPSGGWTVHDDHPENGENYWGKTTYKPHLGAASAWCAAAGPDALDPATDNYPDQATSWMESPAFALPAGQRAVAQFAYWNQSEAEYDWFYWLISAPGIDPVFSWGYWVSGATPGWQIVDFDLNNVPGLGDLAGQTELYLQFGFVSDDGVTFKGPFVDDISILTTADAAPAPTWTVMLYLDGDNDQERDALEDFIDLLAVAGNPEVRFVALVDRAAGYAGNDPEGFYDDWTTTRRYVLKQSTDLWTHDPPIDYEDLGELNMGDPQTLHDFVTWAQTNHPATHYALVIWDHGTGWGPPRPKGMGQTGGRDVAYDLQSDDYLTPAEIREALTGVAHRVEVLGFDAGLMGTTEVAYELATVADYVVASEDERPLIPFNPDRALGWPYYLAFSPTAVNAGTTAQQLCANIVAAYGAYYDLLNVGDLAGWQTSGVPSVSTALSAFGDAMRVALPGQRAAIDSARAASQRLDDDGTDLHNFAAQVAAYSDVTAIDNAAAALMNAIVAPTFLMGQWHDAEHYAAHSAEMRGLGVYLPLGADDPSYPSYNGTTLKFLANPDQKWDEFLAAYLAPLAPSGLSTADRAGDQGDGLVLTWNRSTDDGAGGRNDVSEYRIYRTLSGADTKGARGTPLATVPADDSESYQYTDTGVTKGEEYCYTVRAYNGLESGDSNQSCATPLDDTPPGAPTGVAAADHPGDAGDAIDVSWDRSADDGQGASDVTEYRVLRDGTQVHTVAATGAATYEWTDTGRTRGQEYCYKVRAYDGTNESADSDESCATPADNMPPGPPTGVAATDHPADQGSAIDVSWDRSADDGQGVGDVTEYRVLRDGAQVDTVTATGAATYGWTDTGRTKGQEYCYKVRAYDGTSESADSNQSCATPEDNVAPAPPENLVAADTPADAGGSTSLTWDRSPDDGIGVNDVTEYQVLRRAGGGAAMKQATQIGTVPAIGDESYEFEDTDATTGDEFCYTVRAFDGAQASADSNESCATSAINGPSAPPENLAAADTPNDQGGSITLTWDASADDGGGADSVTEYWIYRKKTTTAFAKIATVAAADQAHYTRADGTATSGTAFTYKVTTWNGVDESTGPTATATSADNLAPAPPQNLQVENLYTPAHLHLTFAPSPDDHAGANDVVEYQVFRDDVLATTIPVAGPVAEYEYTDTSVVVDQQYCYTVKAKDSVNLGNAAGAVCAIVRTSQPPGDLNGDGKVDVLDLTLFRQAWGGVSGGATKQCAVYRADADLDADGDVDRDDFWLLWYNNAPHHQGWTAGDVTGGSPGGACPPGYPNAAPDDFVNIWDLIAFAGRWQSHAGDPGWDEAFDFAGPPGSQPAGPGKPCPVDGVVDFWDLLAFAAAWGTGTGPASVEKGAAPPPAEWADLVRQLDAVRGDRDQMMRLMMQAVQSGGLRR